MEDGGLGIRGDLKIENGKIVNPNLKKSKPHNNRIE
jgi:hypothetical protein